MRMNLPRRLALAAATLACAAFPAGASAQDGQRSSFLLGVLPDTQFYSRYSIPASGELFMNRFGTEPYIEQTKWLVDNQANLEIPFVTHLGDIVDRATVTAEWDVADEAMKVMETGKLPYSILAGNHDVTGNPATEPFPRRFPTTRAAAQTTFGGRDASGMNEWHTFTAEGRTFLVLALSWDPDQADIDWAKSILAANPTLPTILTTHDILGIASDAVTAVEGTQGRRLWDGLISGNDQIFLTLNGHNHGAAHMRKTNAFGNSVDQIVWDYQMAYNGGNGYLGLLEFDFTNKRIQSAVVSPWIRLKPKNTIVPEFDQAVRTEPGANLNLPIDFDQRFARFEGARGPLGAPNGNLLAAAKAKVVEGYEEPDATLPSLPLNDTDYPEVEGTVAHWRFDKSKLGAPEPGTVTATDIAGGADMRRGALAGTAALADLQISSDHHLLSSNGASACFQNNNAGRVSFMNTATGAAINQHAFPQGYTVESFIKIDPNWSATNNQWMGALNREGTRREIANVVNPGWSWDEPAFTLSISNLREVQWNALAISADGNGYRERTNWSGEVMPDRWMHIANVNDPVSKTSTLYVDGAPVLRNSIDAVGLATANKAWRIGATGGNGWFGCVGETRIIDRPTSPDQWLTQRRYLPAEEETEVSGTVPATLALTLGKPAAFEPFVPGLPKTYTASTTATVVSTAGDATLTVADPSASNTGHLVNGAFVLAKPLGGLGVVKTWNGPTSNEPVPVQFTQEIGGNDPLRTGTYSKTLTFTLSTTQP
ncbi:metallophosphoesterase [Solirubrobacter sp. CPCC 204708]|uniref:Metallophosphoesterase n=1 Tax=Solirubrobacter deserti TaxID=2282478 RepID=A0ABT4RKS9_9ACTN|nr:LamG-like jellyroll fold domain-containing protein [Solirubrobacter deserti]MBE2319049.1 metallophosphoesterase [Solirubrobacter deserti]MDA0139126.1 metallophosphoesterase [Solirubrobacter deserti]